MTYPVGRSKASGKKILRFEANCLRPVVIGGGQRPVVIDLWYEANGQMPMVRGWWQKVSGLKPVASGQWSKVSMNTAVDK